MGPARIHGGRSAWQLAELLACARRCWRVALAPEAYSSPSGQSVARSYRRTREPVDDAFESTSRKRVSGSPGSNSRLPLPRTMGSTMRPMASRRSARQQLSDELPAAEDRDRAAGLRLQRRDLGRHVPDDRGRLPWQRLAEGPRRDVLGERVQRLRERIGIRLVRPVAREDLVGAPAEQVGVGFGDALGRRLHLHLVEIGLVPAAVLEPAAAVLVRRARRLHDAVEAQELGRRDAAHQDGSIGVMSWK